MTIAICLLLLISFRTTHLCLAAKTPIIPSANNTRPQRLPLNFVPESYRLEVETFLDDDNEENPFTFAGRVRISIRCRHEARTIVLHSRDLAVESVAVTLDELHADRRRNIEVQRVEQDVKSDFLVVHVNETLISGSMYELHVPFAATIEEDLAGYYRSSYFDSKRNRTLWMSVTQFEAMDARSAFPCFDEPAFKATFEISLGHRPKYIALSNMPLRESVQNTSDWVWDHFEKSVPMSTYLVAYAISQFEHRSTDPHATNGVTIRVWSRPDYLPQVDYALWFTPRVLRFLEHYLDFAYPIAKLDLIAIPSISAAAMENYGLITFAEESLLYSVSKSSLLGQQNVASVIAHEVAHMWFGNLVTMKWWSDVWLNEGLATFMTGLCVQHIHPEWDYEAIYSMENIHISLRLDGSSSTRAVGGAEELGTPDEIAKQFDGGAYEKGATVVRMLQLVLGREAFQDGMRNYLRAHQYGNVVQDDFVQSMQRGRGADGRRPGNGIPLTDIMNTWLRQPGYPVIYVHRNYANKSVSITQRRYFNFKDIEPVWRSSDVAGHHPCWWIPLSRIIHTTTTDGTTTPATTATTATTANDLDQSKSPKTTTTAMLLNWLKCDNRNVSYVTTPPTTTDSTSGFVYRHPDEAASTEWVLHNIEMAGLYRVRYDTHNWMLLIEHLAGPHFRRISPINRAQLIDDAMSEAWFGKLSYGRAMRLMAYLSQEDDYVPWSMALDNLDTLEAELDGTALHELFKDFMRTILTPIYRKVGGLAWDADSFKVNIHLKTLIIQFGCLYGVDDCHTRAVAYFQHWMASRDADTVNGIPIDLRQTVYCTALKMGGPEEFDFLYKRYHHSLSVHERYEILEAMGCAGEKRSLAGNVIRSLLNTGIRRRRKFGGSQIVYERSSVHKILAESDADGEANLTHANQREQYHRNWSKFRVQKDNVAIPVVSQVKTRYTHSRHTWGTSWFDRFHKEVGRFLKTFQSSRMNTNK